MDFNLARGVDLHIIPTKQFKMNHVLIDFATPQTPTNATARNLLANLLETSTHRYPTQTALARQLASLYGAYVNLFVNRLGMMHTVRLRASFVNNRFVNEDLFEKISGLINEILFHPLIDDGEFDGPTFRIQANNLRSTIKSFYDDKQFLASQRLMDLYYRNDSVMKIPSFGQIADLEKLNAKSLVATYQSMIDHDKVDIFVLGDIDPKLARKVFARLPFNNRVPLSNSPLYHQLPYDQVQRKTEYQQVSQAKLNLAYSLPVYYHDSDYYAALVFNGLFGGTPYSKLFTNVREKASLAYYASSRLLPFNGVVSVQTGIRASDQERVQDMIQEQLKDLQNGNFSDEALKEVQDSLINQYRAGHDLASNILEQQLVAKLVNETNKDFVAEIKKVTPADISQVANKMKLQAVYLLSGER
ncbi:insulinase family protein [Limosilactobacillus sp. RRLNB_1_1]|uniref:Insulinase family protein n=1 Tax=Limosilactobacillus albertensis TaxID=2759752 RepID=A0A7W3TPT1_9LACO|nr:pitrilysin family protein [Limosilactobacillus albertensis]MBB1068655.1 insulinase family protein [Limosilactobacillus albertensis]MCD7118246.1 insulinase family protein [Limosilactobacillus albertensis]MCD7127456.1 insulinase family protein [Limosilactobacillus albertensis]